MGLQHWGVTVYLLQMDEDLPLKSCGRDRAFGEGIAKVIVMRILSLRLAATAAGLLAVSATAAGPAEGIGEARAVIEQASASGEVGERPLTVGAQVFLGDRVVTDGKGTAQLLFTDGTRMVVGPNSELMLDAFVFRSAAAENQFAVRALGGAFGFISGNAPSDAYLIHTPSATMGVRGTRFDIAVTAGETNVLLYQGEMAVCGNNMGCTTATAAPD